MNRAVVVLALFAACSPARRFEAPPDPAALVLPAHPPVPVPALPDGTRLRVATLNLHGGADASAERIGAFLASLDLDVVGLQECPSDCVRAVAAAGGFPFADGNGEALLSKTPLDGFTRVDLAQGRSFVHATTTVGGRAFSVYSAHLGWRVAGNLQCREWLDLHVARDPNPYLVALGDFNDEQGSSQIRILDELLEDAWTRLGWYPGQRISWPASGFDGSEGSQLIDFVFFPRALGALVVEGDVVNVSPPLSDHKPAWADLIFPSDPAQPFATDPFAAQRDPLRALPSPRPPNLLTNPGAEEGLAGWEAVGGATTVETREHQLPRSGARFFTGPPDGLGHGSLSQRVSLDAHAADIDAGIGGVLVEAWLATGFSVEAVGDVVSNLPRPYDDGEIVLEALDANGRPLLRESSGRRDTLAYFPWARAISLPPGTRSLRFTCEAHVRAWTGLSNDAAFDDLYLGWAPLSRPVLASAELVADPGANGLVDDAVLGDAWTRLQDLSPQLSTLYPPWSYSGSGLFFADGSNGPETRTFAQPLDLTGQFTAIDAGSLVLRWGGHLRTWQARGRVDLALELSDAEGTTVTVSAPSVSAAEWWPVEQLTRLPPGTASGRLVLTAHLIDGEGGAFADELFARLEHAP